MVNKMVRVAIVGGGASGVATALALKELEPDCQIDLYEGSDRLGGMADSLIDARTQKQVNYGVQGVHESFVHTLQMVTLARSVDPDIPDVKPVSLSSQFVKGQEVWSTEGESDRVISEEDAVRFERMLREAQNHPDVYALLTIVEACRSYSISDKCIYGAVLPTLALFFGTGNQVYWLPASLGAQVFAVKGGKTPITIFDFDPETFIRVRGSPNMRTLPPLRPIYRALENHLRSRGVSVLLGQRVQSVSKLGVVNGTKQYDRVIICAQAEDARSLLSNDHSAKRVLNHAVYHTDVTVTHADEIHMRETFKYDGRHNYYIRTRSTQPRHILDMGFDLTRYQDTGGMPVFQTIFLEPVQEEDVRAIKDTVFKPHVWRQLGHTVNHLVRCAARMKTVQGPVVFFAGSYLLVNSHEIAVMTGIKAAQMALGTTKFPENTFGAPSEAFHELTSQLY